jgi:hypothetical protein
MGVKLAVTGMLQMDLKREKFYFTWVKKKFLKPGFLFI